MRSFIKIALFSTATTSIAVVVACGGSGGSDITIPPGTSTSSSGDPGSSSGNAGSSSGTAGSSSGTAGTPGGDPDAGDDGGGDAATAPCLVASRTCFTGTDVSKRNRGACQDGIQYCSNGVPGPCIGEVLPSTESCNGVDDDCDGVVDNGLPNITCGVGACLNSVSACVAGRPRACVPGTPTAEVCTDMIDNNCNGVVNEGCSCVYVAATGTDVGTCGGLGAPCRNIQYAIDNRAGVGGMPSTVCVSSAAACSGTAATTTYNEAITMKNGIQVLGGYDPATGTRNTLNCATRIAAQTPAGVSFPATVTAPTVIDGFLIDNARTDAVTAAITVTGSTGAVISNNLITGGAATATSYGIRVIDNAGTAATPLINANGIVGGGAPDAIGVGSTNSAPVIRQQCDGALTAAGRCASAACFVPATMGKKFIRGRNNVQGTNSYGVLLTSSPNALVEANGISSADCGGMTGTSSTGDAAGVRLQGNAAGVIVRANNIGSFKAGANSVGVLADPCGGQSPWIFDNERISGSSTVVGAKGDGIRAVGDCHPRIDSNQLIVGGLEVASVDTNGVRCAKDATTGISSKCTIVNNGTPGVNNTGIVGSTSGFPPNSAAIRCDDGACARIDNNRIDGRSGINSFGVVLGNTGTVVQRNWIEGGCPTGTAVGIETANSFARISSNIVFGATCNNVAVMRPASLGMRVYVAAGANEVDVNGNDIFGFNTPAATSCRGITLDVVAGGAPPSGPRGLYRNNIVHSGFCTTAYAVEEASAGADPRIFANNDLFTTGNAGPGAVIYRDEGMTNVATAAALNALVDPTANSNISADPMFTAPFPYASPVINYDYHLRVGSPALNTGTAAGAPAPFLDFFGTARPTGTAVDIGAVEQ